MIKVLLDHSYADDYFVISNIQVNLDDKDEKKRIKKIASNLEGRLVDPDRLLTQRLAEYFGVSVELIDIDTEEIDLM